MSKQSFIPNNEEDLNRLHNVTLTEGQISIILYILEAYNDTSNDPDLPQELDNIFERLETVIDNFYDKDNPEKVTLNQLKSIKGNLL